MHFVDLPRELLVEIFQYCKVLPLTFVSPYFNEVVSNSPVLMRKLTLVITEKTKCQEVVKSVRKHQKILFKFNYKIDDSVLEVFKQFSDCKHLEFMRCILFESTFIRALRCLPNLRQLSVYTTFLKSSIDIEEDQCLELRNLRKLNFRNSDQKFLQILKQSTTTLINLNLSLPHQYPVSTIIEFLEKHNRVEIIEHLTVSEIEETIIVHLLCEMKSLRSLSLEAECVKIEAVRNLNIENTTVESLNLYGRTSSPIDLNTILSFFKKLKRLELEVNSSLEPVNFTHLQRIGKDIETLVIKNCSGDFFNHISLPNLKLFEITDAVLAVSNEDWISFAQRNPKTEVLRVKDELITNEMFVIICSEFRYLREFELFYDPQRLTNEILNFICGPLFPLNIKILKICQRNRQRNSFLSLSSEQKNVLKNNYGFRLILR